MLVVIFLKRVRWQGVWSSLARRESKEGNWGSFQDLSYARVMLDSHVQWVTAASLRRFGISSGLLTKKGSHFLPICLRIPQKNQIFIFLFIPRLCIIDEAHRLKNRNCKLLEGLRLLHLEHRVLLSGTPLQNNVNELFSLLNFLEPQQFNSNEAFMSEFGQLKTEGNRDNHSRTPSHGVA